MPADALVIGGGAVGACVALELVRSGTSVTLLEREAELGTGCSAGTVGSICPSHSAPLAMPSALKAGFTWLLKPDGPLYVEPRAAIVPWLARFIASCRPAQAARRHQFMRELSTVSLELHAGLAAQGLETTFQRQGTLVVCETDSGLEEAKHEATENVEAGLDATVMSAEELRALEPGLSRHFVGGVLYPAEAHCDSKLFVQAVGEAAEAEGALVRTRTEVLALRRKGSRITAVDTTDGTLTAGTVVLASGAWAGRLASAAGLFVPIEGGKGYHVEVPAVEDGPSRPVFGHETRVVVTPLEGRIRIGGTFELSGLDLTVSAQRLRAVDAAGRRAFPSIARLDVQQVWRGLRPCSPDGVPIVGRPASVENLVVATGHTHMGIALAPITGQLVRELVNGEPPSFDMAALSPNRFASLLM